MPAIQPSRLRQQAAGLGDLFIQPERFRSYLHDILEFYANRAHRNVQGAVARTLLSYYEVPPAVIHQVEHELEPFCHADAQATLALADCLWADPYYEVRLLAVFLLSQAQSTPECQIIDRLSAWVKPDEDKQLLFALLNQGARRIRFEQPGEWMELVKRWLAHPENQVKVIGLMALAGMVADETFHDLPVVFTLISPFVYQSTAELQDDILDVFRLLAKRSPAETVYFLKQMLSLSSDIKIPRLVRRCLPLLSEEHQSSLRAALRIKDQ